MAVRILMVDDEADLELLIRQKFRKQLRDGELEFVFARDGRDALEQLEQNLGVEIVLTDLNMPVMDGLTLLARLRESQRLYKTVVVSAYDDMTNIRSAMNRGAFDFLTKPLDFRDLEATISKAQTELTALKEGIYAREQLTAVQYELSVATRIQQSLLPQPITGRSEFEIAGAMLPARQVSGDFFDYFLLDDDRLGFVIGDVSGKGVPAAIFMAVCRTLLRATALQGLPPQECLRYVNRILTRQSNGEVFVTMLYGILDLRDGSLEYGIGGQTPPCLLEQGKPVRVLKDVRGMMLGMFEHAEFESSRLQLQPGEVLFFYTDGVTEAENGNKEFYSYARLRAALERVREGSANAILSEVLEDVRGFTGGLLPSDDITAMTLRYLGPSKRASETD
jgi:sigma-B regulation protein RsbU (phosphoserine phosphatase)